MGLAEEGRGARTGPPDKAATHNVGARRCSGDSARKCGHRKGGDTDTKSTGHDEIS